MIDKLDGLLLLYIISKDWIRILLENKLNFTLRKESSLKTTPRPGVNPIKEI